MYGRRLGLLPSSFGFLRLRLLGPGTGNGTSGAWERGAKSLMPGNVVSGSSISSRFTNYIDFFDQNITAPTHSHATLVQFNKEITASVHLKISLKHAFPIVPSMGERSN